MTEVTTELNELGLTDADFVEQYVAKAKDSLESADEWVRELSNGQPDQGFIQRLAPTVLAALHVEGLIPDSAVNGDDCEGCGKQPKATDNDGLVTDLPSDLLPEQGPSEGEQENVAPEAVQDVTEASTEA